MIIMTKNKSVMDKYDLSSAKWIVTGAAPLGEETAKELLQQHPSWIIRQAYGMTETSTVVCSTSPHDVFFGSSGSLLPGFEVRIVSADGEDITEYGKPGELLVKSPSVVLGYLNNEKATNETFVDGWCKTGDEAVVRKSSKGFEHIFIVDRIKELIKVQVSRSR
jgi:long-subunit acyl-CoA synthetase (AMP-forming)